MTFGVLIAWLLCAALTTQWQMKQRTSHAGGYGHADSKMDSALKSEHNRPVSQMLLPTPLHLRLLLGSLVVPQLSVQPRCIASAVGHVLKW
jgi:hypothetical protein